MCVCYSFFSLYSFKLVLLFIKNGNILTRNTYNWLSIIKIYVIQQICTVYIHQLIVWIVLKRRLKANVTFIKDAIKLVCFLSMLSYLLVKKVIIRLKMFIFSIHWNACFVKSISIHFSYRLFSSFLFKISNNKSFILIYTIVSFKKCVKNFLGLICLL